MCEVPTYRGGVKKALSVYLYFPGSSGASSFLVSLALVSIDDALSNDWVDIYFIAVAEAAGTPEVAV